MTVDCKYNITISENLKSLRFSKNLTQKQLAEGSGITQASISQIESGVRSPTEKIINKLCSFLECKPKDILLVDSDKFSIKDVVLQKINIANKRQLEEINTICNYVMRIKE